MTRTARLRRLCNLRRLEESSQASLLETARNALQQIDNALKSAKDREEAGQALMRTAIQRDNTLDRLAGCEEGAYAARLCHALLKKRRSAEERVLKAREQYLAKRVERRRVETLLEIELEREENAMQRRAQLLLDEWYRTPRLGKKSDSKADELSTEMPTT